MEIKDFVKQALIQIREATSEASSADDKFFLDVDSSKGVHFDLAVVSAQELSGKGEAKIQVAGLVNVGGGTALSGKYEQTSRIQFNVKHRDLVALREESRQLKAHLDNSEDYS